MRVVRIADLDENLASQDWGVIAKVVSRFRPREYTKQGVTGVVQNVIIKDTSGVPAQIALFNESVEQYGSVLEPGSCAVFRNLGIRKDTYPSARWVFSLVVSPKTSIVKSKDMPDVNMEWAVSGSDKPASAIRSTTAKKPKPVLSRARQDAAVTKAYKRPYAKNKVVSRELVAAVTGREPEDFVDDEAEEADEGDEEELHHYH